MRIGDATWSICRSIPGWPYKWGFIQIGTMQANIEIDLGDGRVLARRIAPHSPLIMVLTLANLVEVGAHVAGPFRYPKLAIKQSPDEIPVVGRHLVEVLTYALDHGRLPEATGTLADAR